MSGWIPAASAVVGGFIGVLGTLLGARLQFKEAARVRTEQYDREDKFRLHKDRIDVYGAFYLAAGTARKVLGSKTAEPSMRRDAREQVWVGFTRVLLLGDQKVLGAVRDISAYVTKVVHGSKEFDMADYEALIHRFQKVARCDLVGVD